MEGMTLQNYTNNHLLQNRLKHQTIILFFFTDDKHQKNWRWNSDLYKGKDKRQKNRKGASTGISKSLKTVHSALRDIKLAEYPFSSYVKMQINCLQMELSTRHFIEHQLGIKNIINSGSNGVIINPKIVGNPRKFSPISIQAYVFRNLS